MKVYEVDYKIKSKSNDKYIILADFHGYFDFDLAIEVSNKKCDYVIIAGDLLNGYQWECKDKLKEIKDFLNIIAKDHFVIIALGNHDLMKLTTRGFDNFKRLGEIDNVYPIYNESIILRNNRFTNVLPSLDSFSYPKQDSQQTINELMASFTKIGISEHSKYTEHLIAHNPYHFNHKEVSGIINAFDLIETGHFHDGWIPTEYLDTHYDECLNKNVQEVVKNKVLKTNPNSLSVNPKRDLSRGITYIFDDGYFVLLPNNKIYYYDSNDNTFSLSNKKTLNKRLKEQNVPAIVITGAINTFMKLPIFYPYITSVETTSKIDDFEAKRKIKKLG